MSRHLRDWLHSAAPNESAALATLVSASGSTSKKIGAMMLVGAGGELAGGVTIGGCVDAQVIAAADDIVVHGGRRLLGIALDDDEAWEIGLTCGGGVEVLIERITPADAGDATANAYRSAYRALESDSGAAVVRTLDGAAGALAVDERGARTGTLGDSSLDAAAADVAREALRAGHSRAVTLTATSGEHRVYVDCLVPTATLLIVGAGEIAMALVRIARELGMRTIVVDGRERYASRERFRDADEVRIGMPSEIVAGIAPTPRLAVVLVAHDYKYDLPVLRQLLREPVGYLGLLGSKKRGAAMRDLLRADGFTDAELARIHTPIGLDIGGRSPAELALSIVAEIVAVRSGKRP
jgi:xanthine dehydrogenase accessory factor